jgi:DNA (cytosine-5)-methyltransferase 1
LEQLDGKTNEAGRQTPGMPIIDIFAGAGGLTLGFSSIFRHDFHAVWANDFDRAAVNSYNANFGDHCVLGDIADLLIRSDTSIPSAEVVIGGPPCQGFSLLNRNRAHDPRKQLWRPFLEVVERSGAGIFVMENVPYILGTHEHAQITSAARGLGFTIASAKLCAADYGVPQMRMRAFIIGCKYADPSSVFPPLKTHFNPQKPPKVGFFDIRGGYVDNPRPWRTVRNAIADLPAPIGTELREDPPPFDLHFGRSPTALSQQRYRVVALEGMNRFDLESLAPDITPECWKRKKSGGTDLFGRLWWDRPGPTVRTEFFKPEKGRYLHPVQHRPITHREAARIQSFPDAFKFCGSKTEIAKQIGNAVPPLLATRVADCVDVLLSSKDRTEPLSA